MRPKAYVRRLGLSRHFTPIPFFISPLSNSSHMPLRSPLSDELPCKHCRGKLMLQQAEVATLDILPIVFY